ncbi:P-type ATPase (P-ATPase) Superfamily, partial [Phytophthora palmivora]
VFRGGEWRVLSSPDIAPGDHVKVSENWVVPCDMAIVKGTTVCDESMLTGESMPHMLFAGTRVLSSHAGVALSDAEASVVSPFTSKSKTIQSVADLCREDRCSVATSFASVKFVIVYGLIGSVMWAFQSYHTLSKPLKELKAVRPTSSLIGPTTLVSMLGQQIYCTFSPVNIDVAKWWLLVDNYLSTLF